MMLSRLRLRVEGTVQGVGFRPYVYRLAAGHSLSGHFSANNRIDGIGLADRHDRSDRKYTEGTTSGNDSHGA